jgi:ribosomal protein S18 acetylase RimI-like enzyme
MNVNTVAISIVDYEPKYQKDFERLNRSWIEKYFWMEPLDEFILTKPEVAILFDGGSILMAVAGDYATGTVALRKLNDTTFEFTKMGVDENWRRQGIAEALSLAAIEKARELGAVKIILYSHSSLQPALKLYKKIGFKEVPMDPNEYKRSDVQMEMELSKVHRS